MKSTKPVLSQPFAWLLLTVTVYFLWLLFSTLKNFPLQKFDFDDVGFTKNWLYVATFDWFVVMLCFSVVIMFSEESNGVGAAWCIASYLFGAPVIVAYLLLRYHQHSTLALTQKTTSDYEILSRMHSHSIS